MWLHYHYQWSLFKCSAPSQVSERIACSLLIIKPRKLIFLQFAYFFWQCLYLWTNKTNTYSVALLCSLSNLCRLEEWILMVMSSQSGNCYVREFNWSGRVWKCGLLRILDAWDLQGLGIVAVFVIQTTSYIRYCSFLFLLSQGPVKYNFSFKMDSIIAKWLLTGINFTDMFCDYAFFSRLNQSEIVFVSVNKLLSTVPDAWGGVNTK